MKRAWTKHLAAFALISLWFAGCISEPDFDSGEFICASDADCVSGYRCSDARGVCVKRTAGTTAFCEENFFVDDGECVECAKGYINAAGDNPEGADTMCEPQICGTNRRVENFVCVPCAAGEVNEAGDLASDGGTVCDKVACEADQYVKSNVCTECPSGTRRPPGDDPSGGDTECVSSFCQANERVLQGSCEPCPRGTINDAGDDYTGADTTCDPVVCQENERVFDYACTPCRPGSTNDEGDLATTAYTECTVTFCEEDHYVEANTCRECPAGSRRQAGDDPTGSDTQCTEVFCEENERVYNNICVPCSLGTSSPGGDPAAGPNTRCEVAYCGPNERVFGNKCVACSGADSNLAEDDPTGPDTTCDGTTLCASNYHVVAGECRACAGDQVNYAGDDPAGANTECDGVKCPANFYVETGRCVSCDPGFENDEGDDSAAGDTTCDPILCGADEYVSNFACVSCPPGTTNASGDNATLGDSVCDATLCAANQRVVNNACVACPPGSTNEPGDDASASDTECDPTYCERHERVQAHTCVSCSSGYANGKGDDATGADTVCDGIIALAGGGPCVILEGDAFQWIEESTLQPNDAENSQRFGASVAVDGAFLAAGAPRASESGIRSGAVYLFERVSPGNWIQRQKLKANNLVANEELGQKVVMDGDVIVASAHGVGRGRAIVFSRDPQGVWTQTQVLTASDMAGFSFGLDMELKGNDLVVLDRSGNAYRYQRNAQGMWSEVSKTMIGTGSSSVAFDAGAVAIGWVGYDSAQTQALGAVKVGSQLIEGEFPSGSRFASSIAMEGDVLAVGAPDSEPNSFPKRTGKVHLYEKDASGNWSLAGDIDPPNEEIDLHFGRQVFLSGGSLFISDEDRVYLYRRIAQGDWELQRTIVSKIGSGDVVMASMGTSLAIGVPNGDGSVENAGVVRVFDYRHLMPGSLEHRAEGGVLVCPNDPNIVNGAATTLGTGTDMASFMGLTTIDVSRDESWGCALQADGSVLCWGEGSRGQVRNSSEDSDVPVLTVPTSEATIEAMSLGRSHTCGITSLSQVFCWGASQYNTAASTSGLITGVGSATDLVSDAERTCALSSGSIQCWKGSSGSTTTFPMSAPVAKLADRGGRFAILQDASVITWAEEMTATSSIAGLSNISAVTSSVGGSHHCALTNTGFVFCWGENADGQLGIGSGQDSQTPVQANGLGNVTQVGASGGSTCAVTEDASNATLLACWGAINGSRTPAPVNF